MAAVGAGVLWLATKLIKPKGSAPGAGTSEGDQWQAFPPASQQIAWQMATQILWAGAGKATDGGGRVAPMWTGQPGSAGGAAQVSANDQWLREMMSQGYRILVSDRIAIPELGATRQMVFAPSGFARSALPQGWGPLLQLFAPAPQGMPVPDLPQGMQGQGLGFLDGGDPFSEIRDLSLQTQVRRLAADDGAALKDLDDAAAACDKLPAPRAAAALRSRRVALASARRLDAEHRGGYPYTVRGNGAIALETPFSVARWYGGERPGVMGELGAKNPSTYTGGTWKGWAEGQEVLLPIAWFPDGKTPESRGLPPLLGIPSKPIGPGAPGTAPGPAPAGGGAAAPVVTPWGPWTPGNLPVGTTAQPGVPGTEPYPVPGPPYIVYGPAYGGGKWTPPTPGSIDPYRTLDSSSNP